MVEGPDTPDVSGGDGAENAAGRRSRVLGVVAIAVVVAAAVGVVWVVGRGGDQGAGVPVGRSRVTFPQSHFELTAGSGRGGGGLSWFEVSTVGSSVPSRVVDSVRAPSAEAGEVREILAGPGGVFLVASSRARPCESRLYRFRLAADGHVRELAPVGGGVVPALVAGLAMSPDGNRVAYATVSCVTKTAEGVVPARPIAAAPSVATLNVLDLRTANTRVWISVESPVIGDIVWARDNRTLGYAVANVVHRPPDSYGLPQDTVGGVTVHALDVEAPGRDLLGGRVLFRQSDDSVVDSAVMNSDGRGGHGELRSREPDSGVSLFSFAEGQPMRITEKLPPNTSVMEVSTEPRYACPGSVDAYGRLLGSRFSAVGSFDPCSTAFDRPR